MKMRKKSKKNNKEVITVEENKNPEDIEVKHTILEKRVESEEAITNEVVDETIMLKTKDGE